MALVAHINILEYKAFIFARDFRRCGLLHSCRLISGGNPKQPRLERPPGPFEYSSNNDLSALKLL